MDQFNIDLPALIGSRICHDLISPIGAINNGLELLEMAGTGARACPDRPKCRKRLGPYPVFPHRFWGRWRSDHGPE